MIRFEQEIWGQNASDLYAQGRAAVQAFFPTLSPGMVTWSVEATAVQLISGLVVGYQGTVRAEVDGNMIEADLPPLQQPPPPVSPRWCTIHDIHIEDYRHADAYSPACDGAARAATPEEQAGRVPWPDESE